MAGSPTGNAITNEIAYIANMLGKGRMPYGGSTVGNYLQQLSNPWQRRPTPPRTAQETGMYGRYIPGGQQQPFGGTPQPFGGTPQERAQAAETSRVAQLTAQDPELQRYEAARLKAVAPGATPEQVQSAEDIGMQIWAQKYGKTLAPKVKPGQSGYEAIQGTLAGNMARAGQGFGMAEQLVPTPQGFPAQVPGLPTGAGYSTGFGVNTNLAPGAQTPPPYSTIKPSSELSGLGAAPLGTAQTSTFGQPNVMDPEQFEKLLKMVQK